MRMTTDMQEVAFEHLIGSDLARLNARDAGPARVEADQRHLVHPAGGSRRHQHRRARHSLRRGARHIDVLSRLGDVADRAGGLPHRGAPHCGDQPAPAPRRQAHAERARRHDLAADREAVERAPHQVVPPRELCGQAAQPELRAGVRAAHEGGEGPRPPRPDAGGARRRRGRRRHRVRLLAHRQRHLHGRRLHGLRHRAADGVAADPRARQPVGPHQRGPRRGRELLRARRREAAHRRSAPAPSRSR